MDTYNTYIYAGYIHIHIHICTIHTHTLTYRHIHATNQPAKNHKIMTWAAVLVKNAHKIPYIHIHAYTYRYIPYIHIHTDTYTYSPPSNRVGWGFAGGAAAAQDPVARNSPPRSARMGLDARSPYANSVGGDHWWRQGLALPPPQRVLRARVRQTGSGSGSLMAEKSGLAAAHGRLEWGPQGAAAAGGLWGML